REQRGRLSQDYGAARKVPDQQEDHQLRSADGLFVQSRRLDDVLHICHAIHRAGLQHRAAARTADYHALASDAYEQGHGWRAARFACGHRCYACQLQHSRSGIAADHWDRSIPRYGPLGNKRDWQHPGHSRDRKVGGRTGRPRGIGGCARAQGRLMRVMRARHAWRETANAGSVLGWARIVFAATFLAVPANAQESANVGALSGTLKKIKDTGTIALGYRESSLPFSYLNRRQQPIGYSIDLCREIVEDVSTELDGMEIKITFTPVTPANRLQKVASGEIDLECGSTTGNVQRRKEVAFSPIFFVAGTKLMVPKSSSVSSYRD